MPAFSIACLTLLMVSGWLLRVPAPHIATTDAAISSRSGITTVQGTSSGLELQQQNNRALTVLYRVKEKEPVMLSANTDGSVRARYVDSDTGQVTITNVYTE